VDPDHPPERQPPGPESAEPPSPRFPVSGLEVFPGIGGHDQPLNGDGDRASLLPFPIGIQPNDTTCGPTCLQAVYRFYRDSIPLDRVIREVPTLDTGGTLAVMLGLHALQRGYSARIYTLNLHVWDPTWFQDGGPPLIEAMKAQLAAKADEKLLTACQAYVTFLELGGEVRYEDFTEALVRKHLKRHQPILTGLSATYLYRCAREFGDPSIYDSIRGTPTGHFVVIHGYDPKVRLASVADPLRPNPLTLSQYYQVKIDRLVRAILLGILTYDANILVISPGKKGKKA
jgi:hypothetical protein